jgi:hypothetical protein
MTPSGDVTLPDSDSLVLSFENGSPDGSTVQLSNGSENVVFDLRGRDTKYAVVGADGAPHLRPRLLTWDGDALQGVTWDAAPSRKAVAVTFEIADARTGEKSEFALHRSGSYSALDRVRQRAGRFASFEIPDGVRVMFRRRKRLSFEWVEEVPADVRPDWLNSFIADKSFDVEIDAGPFGSWTSLLRPAATRLSSPALTSSERKRLEWLCWANGSFALGGKPLCKVTDRTLISGVKTLRVKPAFLAHRLALHQVLAR